MTSLFSSLGSYFLYFHSSDDDIDVSLSFIVSSDDNESFSFSFDGIIYRMRVIISSQSKKKSLVLRDQIYMKRVLPKFAPHIGCHTINDIEDHIKSMLTKNQYKMFCNDSIFGVFMKKKNCVVQVQLGRCIMSLETKESSTSDIVIRAKDTSLHFSPRKFAVVTDLNYLSNKDDFVFDEELPNKIIDQYFDGARNIQKRELFVVVSGKIWGEVER
ncbi:hypothetical protein FXO37_27456 [Capsicum annuum]|nr:hypothetical protein FXO37_27456 [Capsicum annuum]